MKIMKTYQKQILRKKTYTVKNKCNMSHDLTHATTTFASQSFIQSTDII